MKMKVFELKLYYPFNLIGSIQFISAVKIESIPYKHTNITNNKEIF